MFSIQLENPIRARIHQNGVFGIAPSSDGPMDSSDASSIGSEEPPHSCSLCPRLKLKPGDNKTTISLSYARVKYSAVAGCCFLKARLDQLESQIRWANSGTSPDPPIDWDVYESDLEIDVCPGEGRCTIYCIWICRWPTEYYYKILLACPVTENGIAARCIKTRPPNPKPMSEENILWMGKCLQYCQKKHKQCNKLRQSMQSRFELPKYMIDLGTSDDDQIHVIETEMAQDEKMSYAILSYCWGPKSAIIDVYKTGSENIQQRLVGCSLSDFPKTIQDAAKVTRALQLRYLWVDAICILQDRKEDLERILDDMRGFYARATIVIAAASAANSNAGFLEPRDLRHKEYDLPITLIDGENIERDRVRLIEREFEKKPEPLDMRCWAHPESKRALRILRFELERVTWRCYEQAGADSDVGVLSFSDEIQTTSSFDGSIFANMLSSTPEEAPEMLLTEWIKLVTEYSARSTRHLIDKLVPFEQTAESFSEAIRWDSSQYKAGIWMDDIHRQLLWCLDDNTKDDDTKDKSSEDKSAEDKSKEDKSAEDKRIEKNNTKNDSVPGGSTSIISAPSWSWAAIPSKIMWSDYNYLDWNQYTLEVVECTVELMSSSHPFKNVKGGQLIINGYAPEAYWDEKNFVECASVSEAHRTSRTSETDARNRSRSPPQTHQTGDRSHRSRSPIGTGRQQLKAEATALPVQVIWDVEEQPESRVKFLEIRANVKDLMKSYGIILSCNGSNPSKRLGYFNFDHREHNVQKERRAEKVDLDWFRQKGRTTICII